MSQRYKKILKLSFPHPHFLLILPRITPFHPPKYHSARCLSLATAHSQPPRPRTHFPAFVCAARFGLAVPRLFFLPSSRVRLCGEVRPRRPASFSLPPASFPTLLFSPPFPLPPPSFPLFIVFCSFLRARVNKLKVFRVDRSHLNVKKACLMQKSCLNILPVRKKSVPLHSLSGKNTVSGKKTSSLTYCKRNKQGSNLI